MLKKMKINAIVACSENNGIGINGQLPWNLREEMKHFTRMTKKTEDPTKRNAVLMGRNTWASIPAKFRPLPGRLNYLVSSQASINPEMFAGCIPCKSYTEAVEKLSQEKDVETVWVIGGQALYKEAFESDTLHRIYLTKIMKNFDCDTFLPEIPSHKFQQVVDEAVSKEEMIEGELKYKYIVYEINQN